MARREPRRERVQLPGGISVPRGVFYGLVAVWVIGFALASLVSILGGADLVEVAYFVIPSIVGVAYGFAAGFFAEDEDDPPPPSLGDGLA